MIGLAVPAPQATCDCFTFFWHVHLQSHLLTRTTTHTHTTHTAAHLLTLPNWALSQYPSQRSKVVVVVVLVLVLVHVIPALPARQAVSQYICSLLVVHRFRQLILLESSTNTLTHTRTYTVLHCCARCCHTFAVSDGKFM